MPLCPAHREVAPRPVAARLAQAPALATAVALACFATACVDLPESLPPLEFEAGVADVGPDCMASDEACNGEDDDCDGVIDEASADPLCPAGGVCQGGECVVDCPEGRVDADGRAENGCECVVGLEVCDDADNDCDGDVDEAVVGPPTSGQAGVCARATQVCVGGQFIDPPREQIDGFELDEVTCDGRDNDCDGRADEGSLLPCTWCEGQDGAPCNGCPDRIVVPPGFVCVPPGALRMGSPVAQPGRDDDEGPVRTVELSYPLLVQLAEQHRADWQIIAQTTPSFFQLGGPEGSCLADPAGALCPVESVSWYDAVWFADLRSRAEGLPSCADPAALEACTGVPGAGCGGETGCDDQFVCDAGLLDTGPGAAPIIDCLGYRLPTEAEWEYFARAGTGTRYWSGDTAADLDRVAWYGNNSGGRPHGVAERPLNPWGLAGVHGNVREWVHDRYGPYPDPMDLPGMIDRDPVSPLAGDSTRRIVRGGDWQADFDDCRSAGRARLDPAQRSHTVGFRLVRRAVPTPP